MNDERIEHLLEELFQKLTATHLEVKEYPVEELSSLLRQIVEAISIDYSTYRKYIARFLSLLEKNDLTSMVLLVDCYLHYYQKLISIKNFQNIDESALSTKYTETTIKKFFKVYEQSLHRGIQIRLSDFSFNSSELTEDEKDGIIAHLVDIIQEHAKKLSWDDDTVQSVLMFLPVLRQLLRERNNYYSFYIVTGMVMDRLGSSEFYQQARDFAEEINLTAFKDNLNYLGFFNSFRCYSNNSSAIPGLLYGALSIHAALNAKEAVPEKFVKEIIWQGIKFFRNISLFPLVKEIYLTIPKHIVFNNYETRSIAHSYFLALLKMGDKKLPEVMLEFLNANREKMYATGVNDALPWLMTLYNVKRLYKDADFSSSGLGPYLETLELIVPKELVATQKAIIDGDLDQLKPLLRSSLIKLNETRSETDVINDNDKALKIASRMIGEAIVKNDIEAIFLSMMVKADYSFIFIQKPRQETAPVKIPTIDQSSFRNIYGAESDATETIISKSKYLFIWMLSSEGDFYYVTLNQGTFRFYRLDTWDHEKFRELITSAFFSHITFDDTIKTKTEVRNVLPEEHKHATDAIKNKFTFLTIDTQGDFLYLLVVFDMDLAGFPHNLLLDLSQEFIYQKKPICNILSNEWYLRNSDRVKLSANFSKAIWIPTEGDDFTIHQLLAKLEQTLIEQKFDIVKSLEPELPISNDINIICAHGAMDIATKQVIYPDADPRLNVTKFLGHGKVLILFVCHSGSIKQTPLKNSISTLVKQFISIGYSAVVAPFWSLHINVPPLWLPIFLTELQKGKEIVEAVHTANMHVGNIYPTLSAWACMHLYGDPHLSISS